ncbi:MAG: serine/threonine-protein kinase [Acidobacteriota bacterium]
MTEDRWRRLEELFVAATGLPSEEQESFARRETDADPELQGELLRMIAHADGAEDRIARAIGNAAQCALPVTPWMGREFGPYRIVREIGHGGMGIVFEAVRDDDQYRKRLALKIAPSWSDSGIMRERLRQERQILADLEHPNIARFLDGGAEEGVPYIAMEFVEGIPITVYCRELPLERRIELFRLVCAAVQYAHESLIVHRDLKPANILVTREGAPKLLDFGIAKILSPLAGAGDTTGTMLWTPDYTSPEQVRGRAVTIRTDVYSLGLILYEILCGERGQSVDTTSPLAMDGSICEREPLPPSERALARGDRALSRQLAGDLDTIVAMAIRKEPERRYGSAAELSADLERYSDGLPVLARAGTLGYRAAKFVRRHRAAAVAVGLIVASLAAGAVTTIHQKRRAERRFDQVRKLANTFVFDVHDRIVRLPGATEARKVIVQSALTYLETLQPEAAGDVALSREIAASYEKIGDVQGSPSTSNLGDTKGAMVSYSRAESILADLLQNGDRTARLPLAGVAHKLGDVRRATGDIKTALKDFERARALCGRMMRESPGDRKLLAVAGEIESSRARTLFELRDSKGVTEASVAAMKIAVKLASMEPANRDYRQGLATAFSSLGTARLAEGQLDEAAANYRSAIEARESLVSEDPNNVSYRRVLMVGYGNLGDVLGFRPGENLGDTAGAVAAFQTALKIARWLSERDPADRKAKFDVVSASLRVGSLLVDDPRQAAAGLRVFEETERGLNRLLAEDPTNARYLYNAVFVGRRMGEAYVALERNGEAARRLERAAAGASQLVQGPFGPAAREQIALANTRLAVIEASGRKGHSIDLADGVLRQMATPPALFRSPWTEAAVLRDLGRVFLKMGRLPEAASCLEKSRERLQGLKPPVALEAKRQSDLAGVQADLIGARRN